jgi:UDP-N-acetylglucosamine:LPS N-acetylglucosamine transferase
MVERDMTVETLGRLITDCLGDASGLAKAAAASRDFGRPDAVDRLIAVARDLMRHDVAREGAA